MSAADLIDSQRRDDARASGEGGLFVSMSVSGMTGSVR